MHRSDMRGGTGADLRLTDAERENAITRLGEHFAAGQLDKDEFDERSDAVWTARTRGDLAPIFADLGPDPAEPARRDRFGTWGRRGWLPLPLGPVLFVLILLTVLTHLPFVLLAVAGCVFVLGRRRHRHWHDV